MTELKSYSWPESSQVIGPKFEIQSALNRFNGVVGSSPAMIPAVWYKSVAQIDHDFTNLEPVLRTNRIFLYESLRVDRHPPFDVRAKIQVHA